MFLSPLRTPCRLRGVPSGHRGGGVLPSRRRFSSPFFPTVLPLQGHSSSPLYWSARVRGLPTAALWREMLPETVSLWATSPLPAFGILLISTLHLMIKFIQRKSLIYLPSARLRHIHFTPLLVCTGHAIDPQDRCRRSISPTLQMFLILFCVC